MAFDAPASDPARPEPEVADAPTVFLLLVLYCAALLACAAIIFGKGTIPNDMAEAWSWGRELQLGYFKHPPFFAWIAYAWVSLTGPGTIAFFALCAANLFVALLGVWRLARLFVSARLALIVVCFLCLTPSYNVLAFNFNANTILLSIWPWLTYYLVRTVRNQGKLDAALVGVLAACAVLSKYYSFLLLAAGLGACIVHPQRRAFFASAAPWIATTVFIALMLPHVWSLHDSQISAIDYAVSRMEFSRAEVLLKIPYFSAACMLALAPATLILFGAERLARGAFPPVPSGFFAPKAQEERWFILCIAGGPFALSIASALIGNVKLAPSFAIPIFFMAPLALVTLTTIHGREGALRVMLAAIALAVAGALTLSPLVGRWLFDWGIQFAAEPRMELAQEVTTLWHQTFGKPLSVLAGSEFYADVAAFYSADQPLVFTDLDYRKAPWIAAERINRDGLLIACQAQDHHCFSQAHDFVGQDTIRVERTLIHTFNNVQGAPEPFVIFMVPPRAEAALRRGVVHVWPMEPKRAEDQGRDSRTGSNGVYPRNLTGRVPRM